MPHDGIHQRVFRGPGHREGLAIRDDVFVGGEADGEDPLADGVELAVLEEDFEPGGPFFHFPVEVFGGSHVKF